MGRSSKDVWDADGSTNLLSFAPEKLKIVTDPAHPLFDERINLPIDEMMVRNIQAFGVLEPVIVTRDLETGDVLVVDGRQRVRHALVANERLERAGLPTLLVPASTRKGDDSATLMGIMVATNEVRQADPPMVRAAKMQRLKNLGRDDEQVALAFGVNKLTVQNTLALLECSKAVRDAVESGQIGVTEARVLSKLKPTEQSAKVRELIEATAGKTGHAKAKAKRAIVQADARPRLKTRKEIESDYVLQSSAKETGYRDGYLAALAWVLGGAPDQPQVDDRTARCSTRAPPKLRDEADSGHRRVAAGRH